MPDTAVGDREDWVQQVAVLASGAGPGLFIITPASGRVNIWYVSSEDGLYRYWNGAAFVEGPPIDLATTIDIATKTSRYVFTVPDEVEDETLNFLGWVNGDKTTAEHRALRVGPRRVVVDLQF